MTRSTARMAGIGAGALLALGMSTAAPAGAADGGQADASVQLETQEAINQTLGLVNQACTDIATVGDAAASTLAAEHGITVSSESSAGILNLQVSLPALTDALPSLGSLPLLGSVVGEVEATRPLQISCAASASGAGVGLTAAGVDVLVDAIAPGVDVSGLNLAIPAVDVPAVDVPAVEIPAVEIPAVDATASVNVSGAALPADASANATAARTLPATPGTPSARFGAAAPTSTTTPAAAEAAPATSDASVSGGTLARTGAGVGGLGLLGGALIGGGRLLAFGRKFLGIG